MRRDAGFTLIEVIVSLMIVATAALPILASLSEATTATIDTADMRKMRHLAQLILSDIELGALVPPGAGIEGEPAERYEEGSSDDFAGWASNGRPDEYAHFRYVVEVLREEVVVGGEDPQALKDAGFGQDEEGRLIGRSVTNEVPGGEDELPAPPGQVKRLLVLAVERLGESAADDMVLRVMTYLPVPGEEERVLGGAAAGIPGGAPGGPPAGAADTGERR
jgi:prepilin-type N-terminal cleavage/methylation domain-containing protein